MGTDTNMNAIDEFISELADLKFENCFNPYSDVCEFNDLPDAPKIRSKNLQKILFALKDAKEIDLWVGRDLGYRGGRRTGLALTDEVSLETYSHHLSLDSNLIRSTVGPAIKERTANNIFRVMSKVKVPILTWNVFPLHPYENGNSLSNRQHKKVEAEIGYQFLEKLCLLFNVKRAVAIGNDAAFWTNRLEITSAHVRHPSYGGQNVFIEQMTHLYELKSLQTDQPSFL